MMTVFARPATIGVFIAALILPACKTSMKLTKNNYFMATITSIKARYEEKHIKVEWTTRNACVQGTYVIERSMDNENFEIIGLRQAVVTGPDNELGFSFIDNDSMAANFFYRIRLLDIENGEIISKAVPAS